MFQKRKLMALEKETCRNETKKILPIPSSFYQQTKTNGFAIPTFLLVSKQYKDLRSSCRISRKLLKHPNVGFVLVFNTFVDIC